MIVCVVSTLHVRACLVLSCPLTYGAPRRAVLGSEQVRNLRGLRTQHCSTGDRQPGSPLAPTWVRDSGNLQMPLGFVAFLTHPAPVEILTSFTSAAWAIQQWVFYLWKGCCFLNIVILWYRICLFKVHLHPTMGAPTRQLLIWPGAGWCPGLGFPELGGGGLWPQPCRWSELPKMATLQQPRTLPPTWRNQP